MAYVRWRPSAKVHRFNLGELACFRVFPQIEDEVFDVVVDALVIAGYGARREIAITTTLNAERNVHVQCFIGMMRHVHYLFSNSSKALWKSS